MGWHCAVMFSIEIQGGITVAFAGVGGRQTWSSGGLLVGSLKAMREGLTVGLIGICLAPGKEVVQIGLADAELARRNVRIVVMAITLAIE